MTLTVSVSHAYGREIFVPECPKSREVASLLNQKTLTRENVEKLKGLGYHFKLKTEKVVL